MPVTEPMIYSIAQQSLQGGRDYNQDRTAIFERAGAVFLVLADGLGGHVGGDIASQAFVDAMSDAFAKATNRQLDDAENFLSLSINSAHHTIHRRAVNNGLPVDSPKTTCVVCLIVDGIATWAHSGDSRFYLIRDHQIIERTIDHISDRKRPDGNNPISRCVGGSKLPKPDIGPSVKLESGDTLFLASDGAWHSFKTDDLYEYVDPNHPSLGIDNLLQKLEVRNKAPSDNLSIVVLFWDIPQLDCSYTTDFEEPNTISLLDESINKSRDEELEKNPPKKLNPEEISDAIDQLESFMNDFDDNF